MTVCIFTYLYHPTMIKHSHNIQVHNKNIKTPIFDRVHSSNLWHFHVFSDKCCSFFCHFSLKQQFTKWIFTFSSFIWHEKLEFNCSEIAKIAIKAMGRRSEVKKNMSSLYETTNWHESCAFMESTKALFVVEIFNVQVAEI